MHSRSVGATRVPLLGRIGSRSGSFFGHCPQHGHQGAVGVYAVGEGVIEGNADARTIHLQFHRFCFHRHHACCSWIAEAAVVLGVGEHRFGMVVVHVFTDPCADGISKGVCRHRDQTGGAIFAVIGSSEALDQQKAEANATEAHIPGQDDEKADGQNIAEIGGHGVWA